MNIIIFGGIFASFMSLAFGIQCHQCQQLADKTCKDRYDPVLYEGNISPCDDGHYCTKFTTIVMIRDSGYITGWERESKVVTRACEPKRGNKEGCIGWQNNGGVTLKCWCGTDGCNTGRSLAPTTTIILSCLISSLVFIFVRLH